MRWDNLTIEADERSRLPGYKDGAVIRRFDAPEALDTRFHEVRAKSALNRVPKQSQVPFRWTINPYRGCSHACLYCLWGPTPILLADGSTRRLDELSVGDRIIGTRVDGRYRRYVETEVLDRWQTIKPAYAVNLEDGTRIITSGDHRFLSRRGWKHVVNTPPGALDRAHLTTNDALMGTGGFAWRPIENESYRRGYLCGMIRGDGHLPTHRYDRDGRETTRFAFRLALTDFEALDRANEYLALFGVVCNERVFAAATPTTREMRSIYTGARSTYERLAELVRWPIHDPNEDWCKGFLAGAFDAEGSAGLGEAVRISNCDGTYVHFTRSCLTRLGFDVTVERPDKPNGLKVVRIRGGLKERIRFFHTVNPAINRKRNIAGLALKSDAKTRVVSIDPLGMDLPLYDITTGTGDFIANGVVSHNCFARPTHTYLDFDAGRDFEKEIVVKVNVPEVLRVELARPSWKREHVAIGTNTDPYQWVEGRYKLMRGIWEAMRDFSNPCSILTKSPLLLRDLDLMLEIAARAPFHANLSIPTMDEKAWRASEPHTPNPKARMEAVAELNRAGIPCGILVAPLMPGINDSPEQVERILTMAAEAGATGISGIALHLRGEVRQVFMEWLRSYRPDLVPRYEELYRRGAYAPQKERERLARLLADARMTAAGTWPKDIRPGGNPRGLYLEEDADPRGVRRSETVEERRGWRQLAPRDQKHTDPADNARTLEQTSLF